MLLNDSDVAQLHMAYHDLAQLWRFTQGLCSRIATVIPVPMRLSSALDTVIALPREMASLPFDS